MHEIYSNLNSDINVSTSIMIGKNKSFFVYSACCPPPSRTIPKPTVDGTSNILTTNANMLHLQFTILRGTKSPGGETEYIRHLLQAPRATLHEVQWCTLLLLIMEQVTSVKCIWVWEREWVWVWVWEWRQLKLQQC